jgi:hypothetical protein
MKVDFRTYSEKKKGFWVETRSSVPCILPKDGLLAIFMRKDIEEFMDQNYPSEIDEARKVWYFNQSRDREIAETDDDRIYANPRVLIENFLT